MMTMPEHWRMKKNCCSALICIRDAGKAHCDGFQWWGALCCWSLAVGASSWEDWCGTAGKDESDYFFTKWCGGEVPDVHHDNRSCFGSRMLWLLMGCECIIGANGEPFEGWTWEQATGIQVQVGGHDAESPNFHQESWWHHDLANPSPWDCHSLSAQRQCTADGRWHPCLDCGHECGGQGRRRCEGWRWLIVKCRSPRGLELRIFNLFGEQGHQKHSMAVAAGGFVTKAQQGQGRLESITPNVFKKEETHCAHCSPQKDTFRIHWTQLLLGLLARLHAFLYRATCSKGGASEHPNVQHWCNGRAGATFAQTLVSCFWQPCSPSRCAKTIPKSRCTVFCIW